jgi:hypothetical protein
LIARKEHYTHTYSTHSLARWQQSVRLTRSAPVLRASACMHPTDRHTPCIARRGRNNRPPGGHYWVRAHLLAPSIAPAILQRRGTAKTGSRHLSGCRGRSKRKCGGAAALAGASALTTRAKSADTDFSCLDDGDHKRREFVKLGDGEKCGSNQDKADNEH